MKLTHSGCAALICTSTIIVGCAETMQRAQTPAPSLGGIQVHVDKAQAKVKSVEAAIAPTFPADAQTLDSASLDLDAARVEITSKQKSIDELTRNLNKSSDRLSYLEPKYSEAVGLLWKWRWISVGTFFAGVIVGFVLLIVLKGWLKTSFPILAAFL